MKLPQSILPADEFFIQDERPPTESDRYSIVDPTQVYSIPGFRGEKQDRTAWCWAAVATSTVNSYNQSLTLQQCNLVSFYFDRSLNRCCVDAGAACNYGARVENSSTYLRQLTGFSYSTPTGPLELQQVAPLMFARRTPLVLQMDPVGDHPTHYIMLVGYDYAGSEKLLAISDPQFGDGRTIMYPYNNVRRGYRCGTDNWVLTFSIVPPTTTPTT